MKNKKSVIMVTIAIIISCVSVGYAILEADFNILAEMQVSNADFRVHLTNLREQSANGTTALVTEAPYIQNGTSYEVSTGATLKLGKSDDYYSYKFNVVNLAKVDAKLERINIQNNLSTSEKESVEFVVTYEDGTEIKVGDKLAVGESYPIKVTYRVKEGKTLPSSAQSISKYVSIIFTYTNDDGLAVSPTACGLKRIDPTNLWTNNQYCTTYAQGEESQMYRYEHAATSQLEANTDYRFIGANPRNYIWFNDEMWRIVGVIPTDNGDGMIQNRIKLVKNRTVGSQVDDAGEVISGTTLNFYWDDKPSGSGSSTGSNGSGDWTDAQLMYFLNNDNIHSALNNDGDKSYASGTDEIWDAEFNGNTLYYMRQYNSQNGWQPMPWKVSTAALTQVDPVTWYLGATTSEEATANDMYNIERGTLHYGNYPTKWVGHVGLLYYSDYSYTYGYGIDSTCNENMYMCDGGDNNSSWLMSLDQRKNWLINPYICSGQNCPSFTMVVEDISGYIGGAFTDATGSAIRPSVYLKTDIALSGSGTEDDPYTVAEIAYDFANSHTNAYGKLNGDVPESIGYNDATFISTVEGNSTVLHFNHKENMYVFKHDETEQDPFYREDYRYIGSSPNNYIEFNGELWRIIGVQTAPDKIQSDPNLNFAAKRYKIMRDEPLSMSTSAYWWMDVGYGQNDNGAGLTTYAKTLVKGDYWNRTGSYASTGLTDESKKYLDSVQWFMGGFDSTQTYDGAGIYTAERGTTVRSGHSTAWEGRIALPYLSDYIYTYGNGVDDTCFNDLKNCSNPSTSWIYKYNNNTYKQWTFTRFSNSSNTGAFVDTNGKQSSGYGGTYSVRPTAFLRAKVKIAGIGTKENPYKIVGME